ncbi:putative uncharacterized protein DDB_G0287457 [Chelonus insularis]|uniref:putative uncharacterized protein DDB_G0287457 n=1 Tax=Chelonus insularis TaxID=460826 RepID=UPI00158A13B6|nr:putative uncharacterized protein DDB_G0287457 [Chelonus insularis]
MPKLKNSSDLNDYCRSRRAELLKRMKHPQDWLERKGIWLSTKKRRIMNGPVAASTSTNNDVQQHNDENGQNAISTDVSRVLIFEDVEMNDYVHRMANDINTVNLIDNDDNLDCNDEDDNISNAEDDAGNKNYNDRNGDSDSNDADRENVDSANNNNCSNSNDDNKSSSNDDYDRDDSSNDDDDNDNNDDEEESGTNNDENDHSDDSEEDVTDDEDNDEADVSNNQLENTIQQENFRNQQVHPYDSDRPLYEGAPIT